MFSKLLPQKISFIKFLLQKIHFKNIFEESALLKNTFQTIYAKNCSPKKIHLKKVALSINTFQKKKKLKNATSKNTFQKIC